MFANLNGAIGLAFAAVFAGPFAADWQLIALGLILMGLIALARYRRFAARLAALGAGVISVLVLAQFAPDTFLVRDGPSALAALDALGASLSGLLFGALSLLAFCNACLTLIWGQSRQTEKSNIPNASNALIASPSMMTQANACR